MIPVWAPLYFQPFDSEAIRNEIIVANLLERSEQKTTLYVNGQSYHSKGSFKDERFADLNKAPHYVLNGDKWDYVSSDIGTFKTYHLTHVPDDPTTKTETWYRCDGKKRPIWHKYKFPWEWQENLPYIRSVVEALPFDYVQMVRLVVQTPPSIGIVHRDADYDHNQEYYKDGFATITMNICSGGANLYFVEDGVEKCIDETKYQYWHFDDSIPHCTTNCTSERIQIRIFGKMSSYKRLLNIST